MEKKDTTIVISIKDLKKSFGDQKVLDGVSLELREKGNLVVL